MEKNKCSLCLLRKNCKMIDVLAKNAQIIESVLEIKISTFLRRDFEDSTFADICKLFVKDEVQELSLPSIDS